ncbi:hypothetical protein [Dongshaea marina]|uniref:hypothetical protein n=1 Tax=Dongshaea marina TaxID=2047966 RepID=UPI00131F2CB4|nr:hypothetical protein [Dongshaea marina]
MRRVCVLLFTFVPMLAHGNFLHCSGAEQKDSSNQLTLNLELPKAMDLSATLSDREGDVTTLLSSLAVGQGKIEVKHGTNEPREHTLIVTQLPDNEMDVPLVGFYIFRHNVHVLKADLYSKERPFYLFSPLYKGAALFTGSCD